MHTQTHAYTHRHTHTHMRTLTDTHTHTCINTHIHTHTETLATPYLSPQPSHNNKNMLSHPECRFTFFMETRPPGDLLSDSFVITHRFLPTGERHPSSFLCIPNYSTHGTQIKPAIYNNVLSQEERESNNHNACD